MDDEQRVYVFVCEDGAVHLVVLPGWWWHSVGLTGLRSHGRLFWLLALYREDEEQLPTLSGFQRTSFPVDLEEDEVPEEVLGRRLFLENRDEESETTTASVQAVYAGVEVAAPPADDERAYLTITERGGVWRREGGLARVAHSDQEWPAAVLDEEVGATWLLILDERSAP